MILRRFLVNFTLPVNSFGIHPNMHYILFTWLIAQILPLLTDFVILLVSNFKFLILTLFQFWSQLISQSSVCVCCETFILAWLYQEKYKKAVVDEVGKLLSHYTTRLTFVKNAKKSLIKLVTSTSLLIFLSRLVGIWNVSKEFVFWSTKKSITLLTEQKAKDNCLQR